MDNNYLSHKWSFHPKYYKKVGTPPNTRYFYSEKEYQTYLKRQQGNGSTAQQTRSVKKPISITSESNDLEYTNHFFDGIINDIKQRRQKNKRRFEAGESLKRRDAEIRDAQLRAQASYRKKQKLDQENDQRRKAAAM